MKELETERLMVRRLTADDAAFILKLLNEPSFLQFIGDRGVRTLDQARDYIEDGPAASYARHGFGLCLVLLKDSREPIGMCGLIKREFLDDPDIGYALLPQFWSKGYAFEAASAVMAHARETFALKRILAVVSPDNRASIGLLGKLGLRFERSIAWPTDGSQLSLYATDG